MGEKTLVILDPTLRRGFTSVPNKVLFATGLSMAAKCLYSILLAFAWQEDECFPGQERLAEAAGCTDRTVRKYLEELKDLGLVSWVQRGLNQTNIYYIHDLTKIQIPESLSRKDRKERSVPDRKGFSVQDRKELSNIIILSNNNVVVVEDCQENNSWQLETTYTSEPDYSIREIQEVARKNCDADLPEKFITDLLKEFPAKRIEEKIKLISTGTGQIRNLPGLLLSALRNDYVDLPGQRANRGAKIYKNKTGRDVPLKPSNSISDSKDAIRKKELIKRLCLS